jgi:hypothetical protein
MLSAPGRVGKAASGSVNLWAGSRMYRHWVAIPLDRLQ